MPMAIPAVIAVGASVAGGLAAVSAAGTAITIAGVALSTTALTAISVGLSIVGTLASVLLSPQPPKPKFQDGSQAIKQAVPPRSRCYGRYRLGGSFIEYVGDGGDLKTLLCHCAHEVDAFEEHWLNDDIVTVDFAHGGAVTSHGYNKFRAGDDSSVYVVNYFGTATQAIAPFVSEWTAAHKGQGLCASYIKYSDLKAEQQQEVFPNGPPTYRATIRGAKVYDPGQGSTFGNEASYRWTDNAAWVCLDYLTRTEPSVNGPVPVGFGIKAERVNLDKFAAAAAICADAIALKAGGTEPRYRAWFAYDLTEDRKQVLGDLLDSCNGRITQGPDGRLGLDVGSPNPVSTVTMTDSEILEFDLSSGKAAIERVNEVRATYISRDQKWAETEAGIQSDLDAIDRNGIESSAIKVRCSPSEGQTQRIARAVLLRSNPKWAGRVRGNLALLDCWGERWVRLQLSELGIDQIFEITGMTFDRTTMTAEINVVSYENWYDWSTANEQDPAGVPADLPGTGTPAAPTGVVATVDHRPVDGATTIAVAVVSWNPPSSSSVNAQGRWRTVPDGDWQLVSVNPGQTSFETGTLADGVNYVAAVRFMYPRGSASDWVETGTFTAVADPFPPPPPTNLTATAVGTTTVNLSAKAPNVGNFAAIRFYRNSVNDGSTAIEIAGPFYVGPNGTATYADHPPAAGDYWYFATSENWSGVKSAKTAGVIGELPPVAPVITSPTSPSNTYDTTPTLSGTSVANAAIKIYSGAVQVGSGTATAGGTWTVTVTTPLGTGLNNLTATASIAGNESAPSGILQLTVDPIDADAWAYINAMTVTPPYARQTLINTFVGALKTAGIWTKMDCIYLLAAHHEQASRLNVKNPGSVTLVATTAGSPATAPTFTIDRGWQGGGADATVGGYLASSFNPTTGTNQFVQDSAHLACWVHQASSGATQGNYREIGGGQSLMATKNPTSVFWAFANATAADVVAQTGDGTGYYAWSRQSSANYHAYQGTNDLGTITRTSSVLISGAFSILRGGSRYSNARVAAGTWGSGLTGTESNALQSALHNYLVGVGAAV
jgi:hypothetical protein